MSIFRLWYLCLCKGSKYLYYYYCNIINILLLYYLPTNFPGVTFVFEFDSKSWFAGLLVLHICLDGPLMNSFFCAVLVFLLRSKTKCSKNIQHSGPACMPLWSFGCPYENSEAQWELYFFPRLSFHGASLRYFHLFWERRSIIRNATGTTQAHTRTLIPLHLSHQIVQGRKNFCDKARPSPRGNHIVQLDGGNLIIEGSNCDLGVCTDADATQGLFVYVNINLKQWRWKILILVSLVQPLPMNENISGISHQLLIYKSEQFGAFCVSCFEIVSWNIWE